MKKGRDDKFTLKWKSIRVCPNEDFTNAMELSETKRDRLDSLDEYIDAELSVQTRIFKHMKCNEKASAKALSALRTAYESRQIDPSSSSSQ